MIDVAVDRLIGFRIGGAGAALPLGVVRVVADRPRVVRVPGSHPFVSGVALHAGVALPVYDLRRFEALWASPRGVGAAGAGTDDRHLIVCDWGEVALGLLGDRVDLVPEAAAEADDALEGEGSCPLRRDYVKRVLRLNGEDIALLDADSLFSSLGVPAVQPRGRREAGEDDSSRG